MRMRRETRSRFGQDRFGVALLLVAIATLGGCQKPPVPPPIVCVVNDGVIRQWIENPAMPIEPASSKYACFYNFAWQELFAVTQLESGVPRFATWPNDQELFPASGDAKPWRTGPRLMRGRQIRKGLGMPGAHGVITDQFKEAAALTPLTDQYRRWAQFSVVINRPEYDYVRCCELYRGNCFNTMGGVLPIPPPIQPPVPSPVQPPVPPPVQPGQSQINLPDGSVELKLAWRVLETCDLPDSKRPCTKEDTSRYLTVRGEVEFFSTGDPAQPVKTFPATLGLIGLHIVHRTSQYPGAIWATFEHVDNAPDCLKNGSAPPQAPPPPGFPGWDFYKAGCDPKNPYCQANQYCPPCPVTVDPKVAAAFNANPHNTWQIPVDAGLGYGHIICTPAPIEFNQPVVLREKGKTVKVMIHLFDPKKCPQPPIPTQTCRSTPISPDVEKVNAQVRGVLAGLEKRLPGLPGVLANYKLVGAEWFADAADDKINKPQGSPTDQKNQVVLSNTTLETYLQGLPPGCALCHSNRVPGGGSVNPVPQKSPMQYNSGLADRSFVFQQIRQFGVPCSTDQAARCGTWKEGCPPPQ